MNEHTKSLGEIIEKARQAQKEIHELNDQLALLKTPVLTDISSLMSIYNSIEANNIREKRLLFVFIASYLCSPASVFGNYSLKTGLRSQIGRIIGRCNGEVSEMLSEAKFHYDNIVSFREKVEINLAENLHIDN